MVWQSSTGGFCTEAAHSPLSWARSASPTPLAFHRAEKHAKLMDGSFGCSGRAKGKQPTTKFLHEDLFSRLGVETGRSFVGWGCQNKLHPSPTPFFSLEEGAAVNLFLCLCSISRIREKSLETVGQSAPAHGDVQRDGGLMLEAVEEFQTCFHLLHPAFHACSSGKNVVFTLLPGKTIRNVNCTAQEVEQGLARKEFFFACKQEDSTFPTILREGVGRI